MSDILLTESLRFTPSEGYYLLDRHLQRLEASAAHFGYPMDRKRIRAALDGLGQTLGQPRKVRLELDAEGDVMVEARPLNPSTPLNISLAQEAVSSEDVYLRHKTSRREVYEGALAAQREADDVLLFNERDELTETCIGNIVLEIDGKRLTPALPAGLLPGTQRAEMLEAGTIEEAVLTREDLAKATALWVINSVRGEVTATLVK